MDDEAFVAALKRDYREAELDQADRAMLDYVARLTEAPATATKADIERLRQNGFGDKAIFEINQIAGFFAWCNRTVDGLGVGLEEFWTIPGMSNV